ncbi:MAG: hypothetical protein R2857_05285 [Vampirovibrionales bacterium]
MSSSNKASSCATCAQNLVGDASVPATITTSQLAVEVSEVNEILDQVASLNKQIALITSTGASPNSLLDQRDVLLDRLSEKMNVDIVRNTNNTNTDIMLNGNILVRGDTVVNRLSVTASLQSRSHRCQIGQPTLT